MLQAEAAAAITTFNLNKEPESTPQFEHESGSCLKQFDHWSQDVSERIDIILFSIFSILQKVSFCFQEQVDFVTKLLWLAVI